LSTAAQPLQADAIEPGAILLFLLLLSAFIALLTLRARLLATVGTSASASAVMTAPWTPAATLIAKASSLRPDF
jgi:hypothetical protein